MTLINLLVAGLMAYWSVNAFAKKEDFFGWLFLIASAINFARALTSIF